MDDEYLILGFDWLPYQDAKGFLATKITTELAQKREQMGISYSYKDKRSFT